MKTLPVIALLSLCSPLGYVSAATVFDADEHSVISSMRDSTYSVTNDTDEKDDELGEASYNVEDCEDTDSDEQSPETDVEKKDLDDCESVVK